MCCYIYWFVVVGLNFSVVWSWYCWVRCFCGICGFVDGVVCFDCVCWSVMVVIGINYGCWLDRLVVVICFFCFGFGYSGSVGDLYVIYYWDVVGCG